jgi:ribosomal protein S18 acetylase RimI-like enzyme
VTTRTALLRREGTARDGRAYLIRPGTPEDAEAMVALRDEIAAEGELIAAAPGETSVIEERLTIARLLSEGGLALTLEVEGEVAGQCMVRRGDDFASDRAEIAIAVRNSARGIGLGRALMETAIDWARAVRVARLVLGVFPSNARAIGLYRALGFTEDRVERPPASSVRRGRDLLFMSLQL